MTETTMTAESTERFVQTENWRIRYFEAGQGHPIVMLHGSGPGATGWSNFSPNMRVLADNFRCIAPDAIGWGGSDAAVNPRQHHLSSLVELLDALGLEKVAVLGNSMGGGVAQRLAAEYPDRVSHLVTMGAGLLVDGVPTMFTPAGPSHGIRILQEAYRNPSFDSMKALVEVMTFNSAVASDELVQERLDAALARPEHLTNFLTQLPGAKGSGNANGAYLHVDARKLAASGVPLMAVHGRDDRVASFESSLRLVSAVPDSRLVLLNRCGHWAQLEHAEEFNGLVEQFVKRS